MGRMKPSELAVEYIIAFCAGDLKAIERLLAPDLRFHGPLHEIRGAESYLAALAEDPPSPSTYRVIRIVEDEVSAAVFWEYPKPERTLVLAQLFRTDGDRITEILLVFDRQEFA